MLLPMQRFYVTKAMMLIFIIYCNVFVSLMCVSCLPSFEERILQGTPFDDCFYVQHMCYENNI